MGGVCVYRHIHTLYILCTVYIFYIIYIRYILYIIHFSFSINNTKNPKISWPIPVESLYNEGRMSAWYLSSI